MRRESSNLYIHIPFCRVKCDYCSFYSVDNLDLRERYVDALKTDIEILSDNYDVSLETVYFGGGSPAVLSIKQVESILYTVYNNFDCKLDELTFELNPEQVNIEYAKSLRSLGVNRVSLGVQSFDQGYLNAIGRKAAASKTIPAYDILRKVGFDNISLDIIYGGPMSNKDFLKTDLDAIIELEPEHISTYCLSVDSDCNLDKRIKSGLVSLPNDENIEEQLEFIVDYLPKHNYHRYEISNYAKKGYESRHNMAYWKYKNTLGAGAAAVYTFGNKRVNNYNNIDRHIEKTELREFPFGEQEILTSEESAIESIIMGLRLKSGIDISEIESRYKIDLMDDLNSWIEKYISLGLMLRDGSIIKLTDRGLNLSNSILSDLF